MPRDEFFFSGEAFKDARQLPHHRVPIFEATAENLRDYGTLVKDFHSEEVVKMQWPKPSGWRTLTTGTGASHALVESDYVIRWSEDILYGDNLAFKDLAGGLVFGKAAQEGSRNELLIRDGNYHPDGSQVFFPKNNQPFVMLFAPPIGDDLTLEMFKCFWFDGSCGFNIAPNVWHHAPLCKDDVSIFHNKQSSVFACVGMDTVQEFGKYLLVPLSL